MKRDYEKEIMSILEAHGGCVTGFNRLKKMGKFHRTTLAEHLREMEDKYLIETTINKQTKRYCLFDLEVKKRFQLQDLELKAVENDLKRVGLLPNERYFLIRNHIRLTYHNFIILSVMYLYNKYQKNNEKLGRYLRRQRRIEWKKIEEKVKLLPLNEKTKLWRAFLKEPPKIISLDDYRKADQIGL